MDQASNDSRRFLSTLPAGRRERRLAAAVVVVSVAIFLAAVPFAKVPLGRVWAFIPIYQSALVVNDLITAILLLGLSAVGDSATPDGRCPARAPSCWNSAKSRSPPASDALRADLLE
jgi:hypothetical protein